MFSLAIIIPCYNEERRLNIEAFQVFSQAEPETLLVFINDGSSDRTKQALESIQKCAVLNTQIISLSKNAGKGEALRAGMFFCLENSIPFIAYADADLSTPLSEIMRLYQIAISEKVDIVLGSRIKKIDTVIIRSTFRHIVGRFIATIIDNKFKLGCYDTQCGAKVLKATSLVSIIQYPFITKWFFDVELLLRYRKKFNAINAREIPLKRWTTKKGSKVNVLQTGLILKELYLLLTKYK